MIWRHRAATFAASVLLRALCAHSRQLNRHIDWTRNGANHDPYYQLPAVFYSNATAATPHQLVAYSASLGADAIQVDAMNEFGYASWLSEVPGQPVYPILVCVAAVPSPTCFLLQTDKRSSRG